MATTAKRSYTKPTPPPPEMQRRHAAETAALRALQDKQFRELRGTQAKASKDLRTQQRTEIAGWRRAEKTRAKLPELEAERDRKRGEVARLEAQIAAAKGEPAATTPPQPTTGTASSLHREPKAGTINCSRCHQDVPLTGEEQRSQAARQKVLRDHRADGCTTRVLPRAS